MILYRIAKWMEERRRLKRLIAEAGGDAAIYQVQKANVERQMIREAYQWLEPGKASIEPYAAVYALDERGSARPVMAPPDDEQAVVTDLLELLTEMRRTANADRLRAEETAAWRRSVPLHVEDLIPEELLRTSAIADEAMHAQP